MGSKTAGGRKTRGLFGLLCLLVLGLTALVGGSAPAAGAAEGAARVPELVSTGGEGSMGDVMRVLGAGDSGDFAVFDSTGMTEDSRHAFYLTGSRATRTDSGWQTVSADPLISGALPAFFRFYKPMAMSADGTKVLLWTTANGVPEDTDGNTDDLYIIDVATGELTWVTHPVAGLTPDSTAGAAVVYAGGSRDLDTVYFQVFNSSLGGGADAFAFYKWHNGTVTPASVMPDGTAEGADRAVWPGQRSGFKIVSNDGAQLAHGGAHPVSDDGSTFYFEGGPFTFNSTLYFRGLFVRRGSTTVQLNLSRASGTVGETPDFATFVGATHDGDTAYFVENQALTDSATPGGGLYRYELPSDTLTQVTPDAGNASGAGFTDAVMSDDASHVYFVASAALAAGATADQPNLYVYSQGQTRFLQTVPAGVTIERVSRSGRFAVLKTTGSIGGAPSNGYVTLYEYDDADGAISCVSCRADGTLSGGDATLEDQALPGFTHSSAQSAPRNITDDGAVFFASTDRLVSDDTTAAADVYEYHNGGLALLSTGRSLYDAYVQDNGDDGRDAFFVTRASMVSADRDNGLADLYDARLGGGFPEASTATPLCDGSDCQGTAAAPELRTPATDRAQVSSRGSSSRIKPSVRVRSVTATQRRRLARGQAVQLAVVVTGGGKIVVTSTAKMGHHRRSAGSAHRVVRQRRRVTAHVRWRLSRAARDALKRYGSLRVALTVRLAGVPGRDDLSIPLTRHAG